VQVLRARVQIGASKRLEKLDRIQNVWLLGSDRTHILGRASIHASKPEATDSEKQIDSSVEE